MSPPTAAAILVALLGALWLFITTLREQKRRQNLPPGPFGLPIIGNLHMLGELPHRTLHRFAQKYGHIMYLRLGQVPTIVVSSPDAAELFLKTHDTVFASRPKTEVAKYAHHGYKGLIFTEYGPYWRNIRKVITVKLLSATKIDSFAEKRDLEVTRMVDSIKGVAESEGVVDVSLKVAEVMENMTCQMVIGRSSDKRFKLKEVFQEGTQLAAVFNIGEFVPLLLPLDLQGVSKKIKAISKRIDKILELIIDEHKDVKKEGSGQNEDFIDVLLSLVSNQNKDLPIELQRDNIKAILLDMLIAAMDTSASTVQWTISEIFRHPRIMKKLQSEIESVVGRHRMVSESDLSKMSYLDMVVKEGMRLHPAVPLLVPHESMEEITIKGYTIPNKSRVLVNIWAIMRDPSAWGERAEEFIPERFEKSDVDVMGRDFKLIPFGSGRRGCAGIRLALIFVRLVIAQLLHCFDWKVEGSANSELDMDEIFGVAMHRARHLHALPTYRLDC